MHDLGRSAVNAKFYWGHLKERDRLVDVGVDGRIILRWILSECGGRAWSRLIWLRRETVSRLL